MNFICILIAKIKRKTLAAVSEVFKWVTFILKSVLTGNCSECTRTRTRHNTVTEETSTNKYISDIFTCLTIFYRCV